MKWMILAAAAVLVLAVHLDARKKRGLSWPDYGRELLGLGPQKPGRQGYLDWLRFLAAMLVILVHSMQSAASSLFSSGGVGGWWYVLTGAAGLGLCCNLLFVMISGALLLPDREEGAALFFRKRVLNVVLPMAAYYWFYLHRSGLLVLTPASLWGAVKTVAAGPMELVPHFWLLYVLIRLSFLVPLFRLAEGRLTDKARLHIGLVVLLGLGAKTALYLGGTGFGFDTVWFSWEGIFLVGYVLAKVKDKRYDRAVWAAGLAAGGLIVWIHCTREDGAVIAANDSLLMAVFSMAVFLWFSRREGRAGQRKKKRISLIPVMAVRLISRYSYSILLIHWFMLFVVVEKHMHIHPLMFGENLVLAGVFLQSAAALFLSLVFALLYDNTVVLAAKRCAGLLLPGRPEKPPAGN